MGPPCQTWSHWRECVCALRYKGTFVNGKRDGRGSCQWPDGASFEGVQEQNELVDGKHVWPDGKTYVGTWKNSTMHGQGVQLFASQLFELLSGSCSDCMQHGNRLAYVVACNKIPPGAFTWPDGQSYQGQYEDGLQEGEGTYKWPDGFAYAGEWSRGSLLIRR
eukprot:4260545-Amphidinium_carterae.1